MTTKVQLPAVPPMSGSFTPETDGDEYPDVTFFNTATVSVEHVEGFDTLTNLVVHVPGVGDVQMYINRAERLALIRELAREDLW